MCKNRVALLFFLLCPLLLYSTAQCSCAASEDPIKEVTLKKEKDVFCLRINFHRHFHFTPRIHLHPKGVKILLSFNRPVAVPKINQKPTDVVKGYFFDRFGPSSLMFVAAFQDPVTFIKKTYTNNTVTVIFKVHHKPTIIIDAGHGGKDHGATGINGELEKKLTLLMALELKKILTKSGKYRVILIREKDEFLPISQRIEKIKQSNGDLLISIHADDNPNNTLSGMSIYTLPSLKKITQTYGKSYDSKKSIRQYYNALFKSREFASILMKFIPKNYLIHTHPCRNSELKILKTSLASVLIEVGYISNPRNAKYLRSKKFRNRINCAIVYAIDAYFNKLKTRCNE